jgi:hypothetical protein
MFKTIKRIKYPFHTLTGIEKEILWQISFYLGTKHPQKDSDIDFITYMGIKNIRFKRNKLHLELVRPGIFIGRKGSLIKEIETMLKEKFEKEIKIYVYESKIENNFYYEYMSDINTL